MKLKWYLEFLIVLVMVVLAIVVALNVDFSSCNKKAVPISKVATKPSPEKVRWLEGKDLFKSNCAACHNPKADGTGPALRGAAARWVAAGSYQEKTGEQWLKIWIRNWNDVVKADYKYGVNMANSRPAQMNIFPYLTDDQIDEIMLYVESSDGLKTEAANQ